MIAELRNLPASRVEFRPTPEVRSVRELAQHILEVSMVFVGELARPDTNVHRASWAGLLRMYGAGARRARSWAELLALLRRQQREGAGALRAAGDPAFHQLMKRFDREPWAKLTMFHHAIAHEEYHRAQLALYARLVGRVPALTQAIEG